MAGRTVAMASTLSANSDATQASHHGRSRSGDLGDALQRAYGQAGHDERQAEIHTEVAPTTPGKVAPCSKGSRLSAAAAPAISAVPMRISRAAVMRRSSPLVDSEPAK